VATDWEAEVVSIQTQNRQARAALLLAQSQQSMPRRGRGRPSRGLRRPKN
jgi:hypothetical protein